MPLLVWRANSRSGTIVHHRGTETARSCFQFCVSCFLICFWGRFEESQWPHFHGHLNPSVRRSVVCTETMPRFHGHLRSLLTAAQWCDQGYAAHRNTRNPRSAVRVGRRNAPSQILQQLVSEKTKPLTDIFTANHRGPASRWLVHLNLCPPAPISTPAPLPPSVGRRDTQTCKQLADPGLLVRD